MNVDEEVFKKMQDNLSKKVASSAVESHLSLIDRKTALLQEQNQRFEQEQNNYFLQAEGMKIQELSALNSELRKQAEESKRESSKNRKIALFAAISSCASAIISIVVLICTFAGAG